MRDTEGVAAQAARDVTRWLESDPQTLCVLNVEADPEYQRRDIDLVWRTKSGPFTVEVKGDRYDQSGNFFFETMSNQEAGTPGCFLYTEADFVHYYFVRSRQLFILPMPATRDWFKARIDRFREVSTTTPYPGGHYTTVGRLVKTDQVLKEVSSTRCVQLTGAERPATPRWRRALATLLAKASGGGPKQQLRLPRSE